MECVEREDNSCGYWKEESIFQRVFKKKQKNITIKTTKTKKNNDRKRNNTNGSR